MRGSDLLVDCPESNTFLNESRLLFSKFLSMNCASIVLSIKYSYPHRKGLVQQNFGHAL